MAKNIVIYSDGTGQIGGLRPEQRLSNIYKIYRSAISSQTAYNRGKIEYNIYSDSCTDAVVDVINNSNIGVTVQNPIFTIRPNTWIKGF